MNGKILPKRRCHLLTQVSPTIVNIDRGTRLSLRTYASWKIMTLDRFHMQNVPRLAGARCKGKAT
jgi:hypothetical protein